MRVGSTLALSRRPRHTSWCRLCMNAERSAQRLDAVVSGILSSPAEAMPVMHSERASHDPMQTHQHIDDSTDSRKDIAWIMRRLRAASGTLKVRNTLPTAHYNSREQADVAVVELDKAFTREASTRFGDRLSSPALTSSAAEAYNTFPSSLAFGPLTTDRATARHTLATPPCYWSFSRL